MQKKIPVRMCVGCGAALPKKELIRVVKTPEGKILLDLSGKANGRGAYLCHSADCLKKAIKTKRLERIFQTEISEDIYSSLERQLADGQ